MIASRNFSVGELHGWHGVLLGLLTSVVLFVGGWQDSKPRPGLSSAFWFIMALLFVGAVIWLGVEAGIWAGTMLGVTVLAIEVWLIWRCLRPQRST